MLNFHTRTVSCLKDMQTFLNPHTKHFYKESDEAIFVHETIFQKFHDILRTHEIRIDEANTWQFTLCLDGHQYSMYLVWIRNESQAKMEFLFDLFTRSVYSFPWESKESLYQPEDRFYIIEDFIRKANLSKYIRRLRLDETRTISSDRIKIIEFDETLPKDALTSFRRILDQHQNHLQSQKVFYLARAFNYLTPLYLNYLKTPFYNPYAITLVLLLLDYHRTNMKRGREIFDIFDLISMKLAIDDARLEYENCEFHKLINKTLQSMVKHENYIKSNTFNLVDYSSGRAPWSGSKHIYQYLIYNFHQYFDRIVNYSDTKTFKIKLSKIRTDHLVDYIANSKAWLTLDIDEIDLNEASGDKLLQILTSSRIPKNSLIKIIWDVNHKWYYSGYHAARNINSHLKNITFSFYGTNKYNFIENFLNWIKLALGTRGLKLNFEFHTEIAYPYIFTNMNVNEISFRSITLTRRLINALKRCYINRVLISECRIQNDHNVIECIEQMDHVWRVYIEHEEHTISIIMQYIEQQLQSRSEFQFDKDIRITCYDYYNSGTPNRLCLRDFKFYRDRTGTKIEVYHKIEKKVVNLCDYLYLDKFNNVNREFEQRDDFMFYQ